MVDGPDVLFLGSGVAAAAAPVGGAVGLGAGERSGDIPRIILGSDVSRVGVRSETVLFLRVKVAYLTLGENVGSIGGVWVLSVGQDVH